MNANNVSVSKHDSVLSESADLRVQPLLYVSTFLFAGFVINVLLGMMAIQHAIDVPYLADIWEFLMLFGSAVGFVVFMLLNETDA
ncbi:hypothetical protein Q4488_17435 [Amphritea sp. 1_MG-2023]|uniref:hypothetical protein n=1 Tax=Amphritea sp. 1_MG-2023 TaxID=3062670 RepID=UPI0026E28F86|nr:hypothetical protein [Amphritea sp. 1_MG-2023]MDO6565163.1 hypothetical protein [Amphritea sp. 1_MG-2023]